jgi:tetratricopeptide (TPR) repeat protein
MARLLMKAAADSALPAVFSNLRRNVYRWENPEDPRLPDEQNQLLYMKALSLASLDELSAGPPVRPSGHGFPAGPAVDASESEARHLIPIRTPALPGLPARVTPQAANDYPEVVAPGVIAAICAAIYSADNGRRTSPQPLATALGDVTRAWELRQSSRYVHLGTLLTGLLHDTAAWLNTAEGEREQAAAAAAAVHTYNLVASLLKRLGAYEMAAVTADRALRIASQSGDPLLEGAAQLRVANVYLSAGRNAQTVAVAAAAADEFPPRPASAPAELASFGALLLTAAVGAARMGEAAQAWEFLGHAKAAVTPSHEHADLFAVFGPVNLAVHGVQVATELGDGREALRRAALVDTRKMPPMLLERRSTLLIDVARSQHIQRDRLAAGETLLEAERVAPEEVRYNPAARTLLGELVTAPAVTSGLREMASRLGVAA